MTQTMLPNFVSTLDAVLRRQIVAVAERMWSTDPEQSVVTVHRTVGFVDLVGYTSSTASLSLRGLTDVLVEFDQRTSEIVAGATVRSSRPSVTRRCSSPSTPRTPATLRST